MPRCLLSLGANIGNAVRTIEEAAAALQARLPQAADAFRLSRLYRTPPVGGPTGQPPFVNAVLAVETRLTAVEVWQAIRDVEQSLGRRRNRRWEARRIDLDILLYDDLRIGSENLKIPHPRMCMRRFILLPALDVAPAWVDPVTGATIEQLADPLKRGAGSLCMVAPGGHKIDAIVAEVSRQAMAFVRPVDPRSMVAVGPHEETRAPSEGASRWIMRVSPEWLLAGGQLRPRPKLIVVLDEASDEEESRADGESEYLRRARQLRLLAPNVDSMGDSIDDLQPWPIIGPRYLLNVADRDWAVHELVAALEAMDCPVEPLADDADRHD